MSDYKSIFTLDLARCVGYASWQPGSLPEIGTYTLPAPDGCVGLYLCKFEDWLRSRCAQHSVDCLVFEKPILIHAGDKKTGFHTAYQLMNLCGTTEKVCYDLDICCSNVEVKQWRKHFLGYGNYSTREAKEYAMAKARACGLKPARHDAAEAFGIMDYTAATFQMETDWPATNILGQRI